MLGCWRLAFVLTLSIHAAARVQHGGGSVDWLYLLHLYLRAGSKGEIDSVAKVV